MGAYSRGRLFNNFTSRVGAYLRGPLIRGITVSHKIRYKSAQYNGCILLLKIMQENENKYGS